MFTSKFRIVFVIILIGLISLTVDAVKEIMVSGQVSFWESLKILIPKYKLYSRIILLATIMYRGG
jgi:uncharacterized protein (DUF983 family)